MSPDLAERLPRQRADVRLQQSGDEDALHDTSGERLFVLNATALALWELCDGRTTPREMVDAICVLFDVRPDEVAGDVERTLDEFARLGLIEWEEQGEREPPG